MTSAARLFGDAWDDWARALARLALSTICEDHQRCALSQAAGDAHANRHKAAELAG